MKLRMGDLVFLTESVDTTVGATLYGLKSKTGRQTLRTIIFPSWNDTLIISLAFALLTQLSLVHGIYSRDKSSAINSVFHSVHRNKFQKGLPMSSDTYNAAVNFMLSELGIADIAAEHSPRRFGAVFRYFVLREDFYYTRDQGIRLLEKPSLNSYVAQGYGTCAAKPEPPWLLIPLKFPISLQNHSLLNN